MSNTSFANKIILVTGASGGIGRSVTSSLIELNARVIAVYNNNRPDFNDAGVISLVKADLSISKEWDRVLHFVYKKYGKLDVLINCTGLLTPGNFLNQSEVIINELISINLLSTLIGTNKILKLMSDQGFGHIINLGSVGGIVPMPYSTVYSATKFALRGFTHSLAEEIKKSGVFISLISPGPVHTEMLKQEASYYKTSIAFLNNPINPKQVVTAIIKTIRKPKTEVIIPSSLSIPSKIVFLFPGLFSRLYRLIEKIGKRKKRTYLKKLFDFSLQK